MAEGGFPAMPLEKSEPPHSTPMTSLESGCSQRCTPDTFLAIFAAISVPCSMVRSVPPMS